MPFRITVQEIEGLDAHDFSDFMSRLLRSEAWRLGIPDDHVDTSCKINDPDEGIDARIRADDNIAGGPWIPPGLSVWQFKSGRSLDATEIAQEVGKPGPKAALEQGGSYRLVWSADKGAAELDKRQGALVAKASEIGAKNKEAARLLLADKLSMWASSYPALWWLEYFGRPLGGFKRVEHWKRERWHQREFVTDDQRSETIDKLQAFAAASAPPANFRVEGLRGIGKSRLVLESVRSPGLRERVLYAPNPEAVPLGFWSWLADAQRASALLVVDECDEAEANGLTQWIDAYDGRVRMITIGVGRRHSGHNPRNHVFLEQLDRAAMQKIIRSHAPAMTHEQVDWIERQSGGFVRLAVACTEAVVANPQMDARKLADSYGVANILEEILLPQEQSRIVMQALSLLTRVGVADEVASEGQALADFADVGWPAFRETVRRMEERGLVSRSGRYCYVTPDLLATRLLAQMMQSRGNEVLRLLDNLPNKESKKALREQLARLGDDETVKPILQQLFSEEGLFPDLDSLNGDGGASFFRSLSYADPQMALSALERLFEGASVQRLERFREGRRSVVWTLEYLKWFPETFWGAAQLLLALAEAENEDFSNNARGIWISLFQLGLSGTSVPVLERHKVLEEALSSESKARRLLAVKAIGATFRTHLTRTSASEEMGPRPVPREWFPPTPQDAGNAVLSALSLLDIAMGDEDDHVKREATAVLLGSARFLARSRLADEFLSRAESLTPSDYSERREQRKTIEDVLEYEEEALSEDQKKRFEALSTGLVGDTFRDQLQRWVGELTFRDMREVEEDQIPEHVAKARQLAEEGFASPDGLRPELDWLGSEDARNIRPFARRLGELDGERTWLPELTSMARGEHGLRLLASYIYGRSHAGDREWRDELLDSWAENEPDLAEAVLQATYEDEASPADADRLISLVENGWLEPDSLGIVVWGDWPRPLPQETFKRLVQAVMTDHGPTATECALALVYRRLELCPEEAESLSSLAWELIERSSEAPGSDMHSHYWGEVLKVYLPEDPTRAARAVLRVFEIENIYSFHKETVLELLRSAAAAAPKDVWKAFITALLRDDQFDYEMMLYLQDFDISVFGVEELFQWAEHEGQEGPKTLSRLCVVTGPELSPLARELLVRYGDDDPVRFSLAGNFRSGTHWGSVTTWLGEMVATAKSWRKDPEPRVRRWANELVANLEAEMTEMRRWEEEENLSRE